MTVKVSDYSELKKSKNSALLIRDIAQVKKLPTEFHNALMQVHKTGDLLTANEVLQVLYPVAKQNERVLVFSVPKKTKLTQAKVEQICTRLVKKAIQLEVKTLTLDLASFAEPYVSVQAAAMALSLVSNLACYRFTEFKSEQKKSAKPGVEIVLATSQKQSCYMAAKHGEKIALAVNQTRSLANQPANKLFPQSLAATAKRIAAKHAKMTCTVLQKQALEKKGFGALLAVGAGSQRPPVLIEMNYKGGKSGKAPIALVGKGITFDSGGISLKPSSKMDEMRYDMSGAATVIGIMQAVAELKLPINLIGVIPAAENMPSGTACRPGDIVKSLSGQTIEIMNTDAEGRLILADAITYAKRYNPAALIDFATLTGAVIVALGHAASGLVSNNDALVKSLEKASMQSGEKVWRLPLWDEYKDLIKTENADVANMGNKPGAGTIVAAAFLEKFVGETPWAHLDIAGTAWGVGGPLYGKGATGVGVRLILSWLEKQSS